MEEKVKNVQARLRKSLSQSRTSESRFAHIPLVSFEEIAGMPSGSEVVVYGVISELKSRGYRVASIKRYGPNTVQETEKSIALPYLEAGSDASLLEMPDRMILVKQASNEASFDDMIDLLGTEYDVIVGEAFGFLAVPKFLITNKPQEGFNVGLPNIIGYISEKDAGAVVPRFSPRNVGAIVDKIESQIIEPQREKGSNKYDC